jgi:hypothetical protein
MSNAQVKLAPQNSLPSQAEKRRSIEAQTNAFLQLGGAIQSIPTGASGQVWKTSRDISLAKKPASPEA